MKIKLILIIALCFIIKMGKTQTQQQKEFGDFINYFKEAKLPLDTRTYMKRKRGENKIKPENYVLKYIYNNDTSKIKYFLELISDDTQQITFSGYVPYVIGAAEFYRINSFTFITYKRDRQDEGRKYYLASFRNEVLSDNLLILSNNPDGDFVDWICSKINRNNVFVFHYMRDNDMLKTEITVSSYIVEENTGRFVLVKQDTFNSKYTIDDFNLGNEKSKNEDPYYRY